MTDDDYDEIWSEYLWSESDEESEFDSVIKGSSQDSTPVLNVIEDQPGYLVLNGGLSGAIVDNPPVNSVTKTRTVPRIPTRDEALDGSCPLFLFDLGQRNAGAARHVLTALHAEHGRHLRIGVMSSIPRHTPKKITDLFSCGVASIRIADPACYLEDSQRLVLKSDDPTDYSKEDQGEEAARSAARRRERSPYLVQRDTENYTKLVVEAQRRLNANLILTSGEAIDPADVRGSLQKLIAEGNEVMSLLEDDERMALNLTLPWECLINRPYAEMILGELLEQQDFDIWYVRGQWNNPEGPLLRDFTALRFYKELAQLADDEDRKLILPQTGLTGWYMLAHGAIGFGTGTARSDQSFVQFKPARRQPGTTNIEYYFEKPLLHSVEFRTHLAIEQEQNYTHCPCEFCSQVKEYRSYSAMLAQWHSVFSQGCLSASIQRDAKRSGRAGATRRLLRKAIGFREKLALVGKDDPKHLSTWLELL